MAPSSLISIAWASASHCKIREAGVWHFGIRGRWPPPHEALVRGVGDFVTAEPAAGNSSLRIYFRGDFFRGGFPMNRSWSRWVVLGVVAASPALIGAEGRGCSGVPPGGTGGSV